MTPNRQIPIKADRQDTILVHSVFYTIQGEGPFAGDPAVFVRLGGCNLQCPQCDTEYSEGSVREEVSRISARVTATLERFEHFHSRKHPLVVITGGEPFRQSIGALTRFLLAKDYRVQVETNGTLYEQDFPYGHPRVTIVCSPKSGKVNAALEPHIAAYKYVLDAGLYDPIDGLPLSALGLPAKPARPLRPGTLVYINPLDSHDFAANQTNLKATAAVAMMYGHRMGIQLHKLLNLE